MALPAAFHPLTPVPWLRDDLGLGCAPIGNLFTPVADDDAVATVHAALDAGVRFFDTAPLYGSGESERRLGLALQGVPRDSYALGTKVGRLLVDAAGSTVAPGSVGRDSVADLSRDAVWRSLESSLALLGTDRVDVLYLHDPLDVDAALSGALTAMTELREQGVVRAIGIGNGVLPVLERYAAEAPVDVLMEAGRLTLIDRGAQERLMPLAAERGISIVAAGVFNSGILVDPEGSPFFDYRRADDVLIERALRMRDVCASHGATLADAAVQFPLRHGADGVVVGARTPEEVLAFVRGRDAAIPDELWSALDEVVAA
ncbi:aldo/keto reductase [Microbacterium bovistercoris]|uniref:Aldo/keto reductase n=1 Tax=Microbacterium bovistercoris TaxID=2293570 RepID=A0A371NW78_9MICO|nr:aldo/keto reductase [Microbacterium bovistercoris]REJ07209.1 aldo/keto reductase [Microbacterium bovistercoris]